MKILAIIPALALAACASTATPPPGALPLPAASEFGTVAAPAATFDNPLAAAQYFARYSPGSDGASTLDLASRRLGGPGSLEMVFSVEGYADDSVAGEQWRVELSRVTGGWRITNAGVRYKCYRGTNPGQWQMELCP